MRLLTPCPLCDKPLELRSECLVGPQTLRTYKCGHAFAETQETKVSQTLDDCKSLDGKKEAFDYQKEGVTFGIESGYNCLIADPMGLGKTIQSLLIARNSKFQRILVLSRASCTYQWFEESKEWYSGSLWSAFIVKGAANFIPPGFSIYIMSMDTLRSWTSKKDKMKELQSLGIDLVIVDECHSFKNPESARTQALVSFLAEISHTEIERPIRLSCTMCQHVWKETTKIKINLRDKASQAVARHYTVCPQCKANVISGADKTVLDDTDNERRMGLILLSGTPIKNRADEYFIPLNLLKPQVFNSQTSFRRMWLEQDPYSGKYNRFKPWKFDEFEAVTRKFIIRRDKNKVLSLPPFRRTFEHIFIEDPKIKLAYNKALADLAANSSKANLSFFDVQESLMTLRRITGAAKIQFATEYVDTFLDTVEDEKIAIGVHHEAVRDGLYYNLSERGFSPLKLSGEDSAERKNQIVQTFTKDSTKRVLIVNMLAGGVGLNLQTCNNILILERQWSAADEEQFEGRFNRQGQTKPVLAEYMIAKGTIDEYFSALVEEKRKICGETLDGWDLAGDSNALRDLVDRTVANRL